MMNNKRVPWADVAKYICIMWAMLSHLEANTSFLHNFYSPFYLCGFFFVSGYVYSHKTGFGQFFAKKVKGLFVPWLFFSVLNILLSQILTFNEHSSLLEELKWNFLQISSKGDGVWFVAALFAAFVPFYFFISKYEKSRKQKKDKFFFIIIAFMLSLISELYCKYMDPNFLPWGTNTLPWHMEYIFVVMFWMTLGYLFKGECEKIFDEYIKTIFVFIMSVVYIIIIYFPYIYECGIKNNILGVLFSYITSFLGVFLLVYTSKKITPNKYLLYIGQNTLICFAIHGKIYSIIQTILKRITVLRYTEILENVMASSVFAICFAVILSFILIIPIYIINRWFPFLLGRKISNRRT